MRYILYYGMFMYKLLILKVVQIQIQNLGEINIPQQFAYSYLIKIYNVVKLDLRYSQKEKANKPRIYYFLIFIQPIHKKTIMCLIINKVDSLLQDKSPMYLK